jgi:hypothetical protein
MVGPEEPVRTKGQAGSNEDKPSEQDGKKKVGVEEAALGLAAIRISEHGTGSLFTAETPLIPNSTEVAGGFWWGDYVIIKGCDGTDTNHGNEPRITFLPDRGRLIPRAGPFLGSYPSPDRKN